MPIALRRDFLLPEDPGVSLPERIPIASYAPGLDARVCARAVELLDKLRQSEMMPFGSESRVASTTDSSFSILEISDLKNPYAGPWLVTGVGCFGGTALAASASGAVPSNLALWIYDNDRGMTLMKTAVLLPVLFDLDSNKTYLIRPHVMGPAASLYVRVENQGGASTGVWVSFTGETVLGKKITAAEVREAIGLGVYPSPQWRSGLWSGGALASLFDNDAVCATQSGEQLRWELRSRIAYLRLKLAESSLRPFSLYGRAIDVPQAGSLPVEIASLRNDSGFPLLVSKVTFGTVASLAATAIGAIFSNIAIQVFLTGGLEEDRYMLWRRVLAPTLVARATSIWQFERPVLVRSDEAFKVTALEQYIAATTDLYANFQGFYAQGLSADEARECVALGLLSGWSRPGD